MHRWVLFAFATIIIPLTYSISYGVRIHEMSMMMLMGGGGGRVLSAWAPLPAFITPIWNWQLETGCRVLLAFATIIITPLTFSISYSALLGGCPPFRVVRCPLPALIGSIWRLLGLLDIACLCRHHHCPTSYGTSGPLCSKPCLAPCSCPSWPL